MSFKQPAIRQEYLVLSCFFAFLCYWFRFYFTSDPVAAWDLPGHIALIEKLIDQRSISFYDRFWFSGWPAFSFYAFGAHLLAAVISLPLSFFSDEPVRLAVQSLLVICNASLPFSIYFAALPLLNEFSSNKQVTIKDRTVLAFVICVFTFWFLNHDRQWFGIGAASTMHVGLFSQAFGWNFLVIYLGFLFRVISTPTRKHIYGMIVAFVLLFLTHSLTALFALSVTALSWCWYDKRRKTLFLIHFVGILICSFWLVPFLKYSSTFTVLDIHRPKGDFFELFFRYPLYALYRTSLSALDGNLTTLNITNLFMLLIAVIAVTNKRVRENRLLINFLIFSLLLLAIFSSGFVASSVPLGIHYYRFHAYIFLLFILLFSVIPLSFVVGKNKLFTAIVLIGALLSFINTTFLPHYERDKIIASISGDYLDSENQVLEYFKNKSDKGRVFFEYNTGSKFSFLSVHYLESQLGKVTGWETVNGLFIQSSIAYRMPVVSANLLGANTYNVPLLFTDRAVLDDVTKIAQLKSFGVTHVVAGSSKFYRRIKSFAVGEVEHIGHYWIVPIAEAFSPSNYSEKVFIGYKDNKGNLPFKFVEFYFYARAKLFNRYELINLTNESIVPKEIQLMLVNGEPRERYADKKIIKLDFRNDYQINHYSVQYQHNFELDDFNIAEKYFDKTVKIIQLLERFELRPIGPEITIPSFTWSKDGQSFSLAKLTPGKLLRINYSYFPYWNSSDGTVFRGSGERIFFLPKSTKATLSYD